MTGIPRSEHPSAEGDVRRYQAVMRSSRAGLSRAADEVEAIVNTLIGKKKF